MATSGLLRVLPTTAQPSPNARPLYLTDVCEASFSAGFSGEELDEELVFHWMELVGRLAFDQRPDERFLEMWVLSEFLDLSQELEIVVGSRRHQITLAKGWQRISVSVPAGVEEAQLTANKLFPKAYYPMDSRQLAVRIGSPRLHPDGERHRHLARQHENSLLNQREMMAGKVVLDSYPSSLGIDIHGVCNVKPPCVYCEWDVSKRLEGDNVDAPFTTETLREYGEFFDSPVTLINCSIGEPFMKKDIDEILDAFGDQGKVLELTTNGQILTDRNIERLIGRHIHLYISLDAATPATYSKLRNDSFERIQQNLRRLIAAKGGRGKLPLVYLVFMPMKVNVAEADDFVRLCAEIGVDRLVLRPLNAHDADTPEELHWQRSGYEFKYEEELLPLPELIKVSGRVAELCKRLGVELSDQLDFGGAIEEQFQEEYAAGRGQVDVIVSSPAVAAAPSPEDNPQVEDVVAKPPEAAKSSSSPLASDAKEVEPEKEAALPSLGEGSLPICLEPWKSLYILRRGVFPCCYGGVKMAPTEDYRQAWNSPLMQEIRSELAEGRLHTYCSRSPACPIIRKASPETLEKVRLTRFEQMRRLWARINRLSGGLPRRLLGGIKEPIADWLRRRGGQLVTSRW